MTIPFEERVRRASKAVARLQNCLPPEIAPLAKAVPVHYERVPSEAILVEGFEADILGLFSGTSYGGEYSESDPAPPQIFLYLDNLWDFAEGDWQAFHEELRVTYLHELGHYLGWDEDDLAQRGLD